MFVTFHYIIVVTKTCSKRRNGSCCWCRNNKRGKRICGVKRVSQIAPQHGQRACACLWEHVHCDGDTERVGAKALNKSWKCRARGRHYIVHLGHCSSTPKPELRKASVASLTILRRRVPQCSCREIVWLSARYSKFNMDLMCEMNESLCVFPVSTDHFSFYKFHLYIGALCHSPWSSAWK